jgi:broad specificity phosphatase PhoE
MKRLIAVLLPLVFASVAFAHEPSQLTTIILVRHAEKVTDPAIKDPALTPAGEERAQTLARMLAGNDITAIYTTPYVRTRSTAAPLAAAKKLTPIEIATGASYAHDLAAKLREQHGTIVVVGHSNTTPDVIKALGIENPPAIPDSDFDNLFIVTIGDNVIPSMVQLKYGASMPATPSAPPTPH